MRRFMAHVVPSHFGPCEGVWKMEISILELAAPKESQELERRT
jgi:hypothetical protein